ncbi:Cleavage polyadenylation factor subunit clp1 [Batrachochytrium dendrobatidis]
MPDPEQDLVSLPRKWQLEPEQEFRFEVAPGSKFKGTVKLVSGRAEIFGSELAVGINYVFTGRKLAVFTWHGCVLETVGLFTVEYIGYETPMQSYLNVHLALEGMRDAAQLKNEPGPRVIIVGQADSGKTALAKLLINFAAKQSRAPVFVDLDPSQGTVSLPGTLSAMVVGRPLDCEEEFGAPLTVAGTTPLVYYHGQATPLEKISLYNSIVKKLSLVVDKKLESSENKASGLIADTPSQFADPNGFEHLNHTIEALKANVILVIGHERLYSDLFRKYSDKPGMNVVKLNKSGGVVTRDKEIRRKMQMQRVKEYFYGTHKTEMMPFSQTVPFSEVVVRRVGEGILAPSSALPLGTERKQQDTKYVKVEPGDILLHSILALSQAPLPGVVGPSGLPTKIYTPEEESQTLLESNVAGFIYISEVEDERRKMTVLAPSPGKIPKQFLIMGTLKWMDI